MFRLLCSIAPVPKLEWHSEACETGTGYYAHAGDLLLTITPNTQSRHGHRFIAIAKDGAWLIDAACGPTPSTAQLFAERWLDRYRHPKSPQPANVSR
jgi:hypothetical protein